MQSLFRKHTAVGMGAWTYFYSFGVPTTLLSLLALSCSICYWSIVNEKLSQLSQCNCCSATRLCSTMKDSFHAMREARARAAEKRAQEKMDADAAVSVVVVNPMDSVMLTSETPSP